MAVPHQDFVFLLLHWDNGSHPANKVAVTTPPCQCRSCGPPPHFAGSSIHGVFLPARVQYGHMCEIDMVSCQTVPAIRHGRAVKRFANARRSHTVGERLLCV